MRGHKRLLLWPESALDALQPYPEDHHLARRLQVDPRRGHEPASWQSDAQRAAAAAPLEARLGIIAANWAFYGAIREGDAAAMRDAWHPDEAKCSVIYPARAPIVGRRNVMRSWDAVLAVPTEIVPTDVEVVCAL